MTVERSDHDAFIHEKAICDSPNAFAIAMSAQSYFLFERFFLRAKLRFSAIESRPI